MFFEKRHCVGGAEHPAGDFERRAAKGARGTSRGAIGVFMVAFWKEEFAWTDPREHIFKERGVALFDCEFAGGEFDGGHGGARFGASTGDECGGNAVCSRVVEERFIDQRSWREDAGHSTLNHTLGFGRVLQLLADRDSVALLNQAAQVALNGVERNAGHRLTAGAFGQSDAKRAVCGDGVFIKELIEVAHPEEQQAPRVLALDAVVLAHGRGIPVVCAGCDFCSWFASGHRVRCYGRGRIWSILGKNNATRSLAGCGVGYRAPSSSGVDEDRTHNLLDATEALFQLSYHPSGRTKQSIRLNRAPQGVTVFRRCSIV